MATVPTLNARYRPIKAITESLKVCRGFFCFCFFSQGFKQTYILKRIKKKYLALELNSVKIGKYALALGCQRS